MKMKFSRILALLLVGMLPLCSYADIEITGTYTAKDGSVVSKTDYCFPDIYLIRSL